MAVLNYNELQKNKTGNLKTGKGLSGVHNNTSPSDNDYPGYIDWWGGESPGYHTGTDPSTGGSTIITTGSDGLPNYGGAPAGVGAVLSAAQHIVQRRWISGNSLP